LSVSPIAEAEGRDAVPLNKAMHTPVMIVCSGEVTSPNEAEILVNLRVPLHPSLF